MTFIDGLKRGLERTYEGFSRYNWIYDLTEESRYTPFADYKRGLLTAISYIDEPLSSDKEVQETLRSVIDEEYSLASA